jgi:hypothetical protein
MNLLHKCSLSEERTSTKLCPGISLCPVIPTSLDAFLLIAIHSVAATFPRRMACSDTLNRRECNAVFWSDSCSPLRVSGGRGMIVVILTIAVLGLLVVSLTTPSFSNRS